MSDPGVAIVVDGRTFRPAIHTTFEQDLHIMALMGETGAEGALGRYGDAPLEQWVTGLLTTLYRSGNVFAMLGAMLVEDGVDWTPARAHANAELFRRVTDPGAKRAIQASIVAIVLGFFVNGATSRGISLKSLVAEVAASTGDPSLRGGTERATATSTASANGGRAAREAPSTLDTGTDWFASLPDTIRPASLTSSDGLSAKG